jgi:HAE1 family hydrophobic/amphiphilic exporter-1
LGLAVVGGLIFSQIITLYITPVYYVYLDEVQNWLNRKWSDLTGRRKRGERRTQEPVPAD